MPRLTIDLTVVVFTDNTAWLEESDDRRVESSEEMITRLEDEIANGDLTMSEAFTYLQDYLK